MRTNDKHTVPFDGAKVTVIGGLIGRGKDMRLNLHVQEVVPESAEVGRMRWSMASVGQAGGPVKHVGLSCLVINCTASVFEAPGGRINACGGIIETNNVGGRLIAAQGRITNVYVVVVGVADDGR